MNQLVVNIDVESPIDYITILIFMYLNCIELNSHIDYITILIYVNIYLLVHVFYKYITYTV